LSFAELVREGSPSLEQFLFEAALEKSSVADRAAFLDGVCRGNPTLRARLDLLLDGYFQADGFMSNSSSRVEARPARPQPPEDDPTSILIGRYKLLERIGEGGFGEVWMAEQLEPVKRRVALKIIKLGMDTRQVVARFEAERQALALMDHPNIAKVLDAGATETGRPYFVMELVRGIRITEYCDKNQLSAQQRLSLFIQVCRAVQHAHQKGIIHRDIKPSNILVTLHDGVPVPKVIDFGIAKATQQELTDKTVFTQFRQFLGTPAYISPEQAEMSGLDIDTRADIYSLGVLLYELLTGRTPFDTDELLRTGLDGLRRIIREQQPVRPSTRLSQSQRAARGTAGQSKTADPKSRIEDDLDWIVMKCLEKDRTRRYETANGLARDIERHLNHQPVTVRPPSRLYELEKTLRRHWIGFAAGAAVVVALAFGVVVSSLEAARAHRAELRAQQALAGEVKQKRVAQQRLYDSLLAQARATRLDRRVGFRERAFALLQQAGALNSPQNNLADLRREAVACLGDFVGLTPLSFTNFPADITTSRLSASGELAAFGLTDGTVELREMPSGREVARFATTNGIVHQFCFDSAGGQLFAVTWPPETDQRQSLTHRRVYAWSHRTDGRWEETGNRAVPGATVKLFSNDTGVFDVLLDMSGSGDVRTQKFTLLNLRTGALVPGREVTRTAPLNQRFNFEASPDGRHLTVGSSMSRQNPVAEGTVLIELYDWNTGQRLNQLSGAFANILSFSGDGKYLACFAGLGNGIGIYTVPNLERIAQFQEPELAPPVFAADTVAFHHSQSRIRLWSLAAKQEVATLEHVERGWPVTASSDGKALLSAALRRALLYQLNTPEKLDLRAHGAAVNVVAFSPDGSRLASVSHDPVVRVCDARTGRLIWQTNDLAAPSNAIGYSPDGRWLVTGDSTGSNLVCVLRDAQTGQSLLALATNEVGAIYSAQLSPNGRYLMTSGDRIALWTLEQGKPGALDAHLMAKLTEFPGQHSVPQFAPDSQSLVWSAKAATNSSPPGTVFVWDFTRSVECRGVAPVLGMSLQTVSFTPDSRHVLAMDPNRQIVTWDLATGKSVGAFEVEEQRARTGSFMVVLCLSPDGSTLALNSPSGLGVDLWDYRAGRLLYSLPDESGRVTGLAWSSDSRHLAITRNYGAIAIWSLETVDQILAHVGLSP
jgi:serine/threonine protein kinase/WD40 repeat protein